MKFLADLHTHTVASGHAYSTVHENAVAAAARGLKLMAVTDHGPALPGGAHPYHFWNLRILPDEIEGVTILTGVEANITNAKGKLDLDDDALNALDVVLVGLHPLCGYEPGTIAENTDTLVMAMSNPLAHIVVHPGNPWFPVDPGEVAAAALEYNVLLEINNSSFVKSRPGGEEMSREVARAAFELGLDIILGSDAHLASLVGGFDEATAEATAIGFPAERIINTDVDKIMTFLKSKRG
jgi:putative hydrolase